MSQGMAEEGFGPFLFGMMVGQACCARLTASGKLAIGNPAVRSLSPMSLLLRASLTQSRVSVYPLLSVVCHSSHGSKHGLVTTASTVVEDLHSR